MLICTRPVEGQISGSKVDHGIKRIIDGTGLILGLHPANERHRYKVMLRLIG